MNIEWHVFVAHVRHSKHLWKSEARRCDSLYRAMLCIARTTLLQDVCPSVCPSHHGIVSKRLIKLFQRRAATPF